MEPGSVRRFWILRLHGSIRAEATNGKLPVPQDCLIAFGNYYKGRSNGSGKNYKVVGRHGSTQDMECLGSVEEDMIERKDTATLKKGNRSATI